MWVALWHGGHSYSAPYADDAETFHSLKHAGQAMQYRRDWGHHYPQSFRYVLREPDSTLTPCAHSEQSGYMALYWIPVTLLRSDEGKARIRELVETMPAARYLTLGPRGGVRHELP